MPVETAKGGKADWSPDGTTYTNIPDVRLWRLRPATEAKRYASSSTGGAPRRLEGIDDFTVDIDLYIDSANQFDADMGITEGSNGYLKLWKNATQFYIAPVYIDEVPVDVAIEAGDPVSGSIRASGNGTLIRP